MTLPTMGIREECGIFGAIGPDDAAQFTAIGLHALQHRGQEACGIVAYDSEANAFNNVRRMGYVRDHFTKPGIMALLPGSTALGHVRYSTSGSRGESAMRNVQPLFAEFLQGGVAIAHNGNLTNAEKLRSQLITEGSIFQSDSDTECILHLMAKSGGKTAADRMRRAFLLLQGAFSVVAMTRTKLIGVRDPHGFRPLVLGRLEDGYAFASETCALDAVGARFEREVKPGEMITVTENTIHSEFPFQKAKCRFCIFEHVYFSRPNSVHDGRSVYETRDRIGVELAKEAPVEADVVCPVPDSGIPAASGYSRESGIPMAFGINRNTFSGRTFIEPTGQIRNMGVMLKLNINGPIVKDKRVVIVDDSIVRGTTIKKIASMIYGFGAREVHFRVASPPVRHPCFYGVDMPSKKDLIIAKMEESGMNAAQMAQSIGVDSLHFVSIEGLHRACGSNSGDTGYCDACFTGNYPITVDSRVDSPALPLDIPH